MNNLNRAGFPNNFNSQSTMFRNSRNQGNSTQIPTKINPFPQQPLGNPDHQNLNLPSRRVPWSPPPRRHHALPLHSRYRFVPEYPQQSVLLQGIFFPIRQPGDVLLNPQLMAPPQHRLQYQGLAPNTLKAPAGYRRPLQLDPITYNRNQHHERPVPLEHRRVLQNHQPVSRYVN